MITIEEKSDEVTVALTVSKNSLTGLQDARTYAGEFESDDDFVQFLLTGCAHRDRLLTQIVNLLAEKSAPPNEVLLLETIRANALKDAAVAPDAATSPFTSTSTYQRHCLQVARECTELIAALNQEQSSS